MEIKITNQLIDIMKKIKVNENQNIADVVDSALHSLGIDNAKCKYPDLYAYVLNIIEENMEK